jgi:hypothetical protein
MTIFYKLLRLLKKNYPSCKIRVRRVNQKHFGHCWRDDDDENSFRITIRKDMSEPMAIDTLIHEFAHVGAYGEWERTGVEHNPVWSIHFAECYRIYEENFLA